jgi:hypothetical protein
MRVRARKRATLGLLAASILPFAAACSLGPDGPATIEGRITGHPALGAVVLEVTWQGITGIEGRGSTQAYSAPSPTSPNGRRVVLVGPEISQLPFAIEVESPLAELPTITVREAVNIGNLPVDHTTLRVVLEY